MKKLIKKSMSLLLTGVMLLGMTTPVFATIKETNTVTTDRTTETEVIYNQESSFMVQIPKLIDLGSDKLTNYTVNVSGDISSDEVVKVVPEDNFLMKDISGGENPKTDITATVTQDKTEWIFNEFDIIGNGNVSAPDLTSGKWQGSFWFNINLEKNILEPGLYDANGVMLCTWEDSGIDIDQPMYWPNSSKEDSAMYIINNVYPETTMVVLPNNIETIGAYEFYDCDNLDTIIIPDGVTDIRGATFQNCDKLKNIIIPNSVVYLSKDSFLNTPWLEEKRAENPLVIVNEILIDGETATGDVIIPNNVTKIGSSTFKSNTNLTSVSIPDSVTIIEHSAFSFCPNLSNVILPDSIIEINEKVFMGCTSLTDMSIPKNITSIPEYLFADCSNLVNITISENITNFGWECFRATPFSENNRIENGLVIVNNVVVDGTQTSGEVIIPDGVTAIAEYAFYNNFSIFTNIVLPESVTAIYNYAFSHCYIDNINIPNNIEYIENNIFYATTWLEEKQKENPLVIVNDILIDGTTATGDIVIPNNIKIITPGAFSGNSNITSIVLPENITFIGDSTFSSCTNLTNITIPENVTCIERSAFTYCTKLTEIIIPKNVNYIGVDAFRGCDNLNSIIFEDPTNWCYVNPFNSTTKPTDVSDSTSNMIYFTPKNSGKYLIKKAD